MEKSDSNSSFEKESPPRHNNGSENEEEIDQILNERIKRTRGKGVIYKFVERFGRRFSQSIIVKRRLELRLHSEKLKKYRIYFI